MKIRRLLGTVALMAAMLACSWIDNIPFRIDFDPQQSIDYYSVDVISMAVTPPSGSGILTLLVQYDSPGEFQASSTHWFPGWVTCNYTTPDGASFLIGEIHPPNESKEGVIQTANLLFSVNEDGLYTATCTNHTLTSRATTTFTVTGNVTPTPTLESGATVTPTPTFTLTSGKITYDEASEQLSPHKNEWGYYPSQHHKWCAPTVTIDSNGNISGSCYSAANPAGLYGDWNGGATIEGTITGTVIPGGSFTFREELIEKYQAGTSFEYTRKVVLIGTGSFSPGSATHATGTATLDATCNTVDNYANICGDYPSLYDHFTGTISWEFNGTGVTPGVLLQLQ